MDTFRISIRLVFVACAVLFAVSGCSDDAEKAREASNTASTGGAKPGPAPCGEGLLCDDACVDVQQEAQHCGRCGLGCASGQRCVGGRCASSCDGPYTLGAGLYTSKLGTNRRYSAVAGGDFDGDGLGELAVVTRADLVSSSEHELGFVEWTGDGFEYLEESAGPVIVGVSALHTADLDGEGSDDLVVVRDRSIVTLIATDRFTFSERVYELPLVITADVADVDGDGTDDVVVVHRNGEAPSQATVLHNDGAGVLATAQVIDLAGYAAGATLGDVDADGDADLVSVAAYPLRDATANVGPHFQVAVNGGDGGFTLKESQPIDAHDDGWSRSVVRLTDVDGDAHVDLVYGRNQGSLLDGKIIEWRRGDGAAGFGEAEILDEDALAGRFEVLDFLPEGGDEVITYWQSGATTISGYHGGEVIPYGGPIAFGSNIKSVEVFDLTGDGVAEVILVAEGYRGVHIDVADGAQAPRWSRLGFSNILRAADVVAIDVDNDGRHELAARYISDLVVFRVETNGRLEEISRIEYPEDLRGEIYAADFDGDGHVDVVLPSKGADFNDSSDNVVVMFWNNGGGAFEPAIVSLPDQYLNPKGVAPVDLDGDGDAELSMQGLAFLDFADRAPVQSEILSPGEWLTAVDIDGDGLREWFGYKSGFFRMWRFESDEWLEQGSLEISISRPLTHDVDGDGLTDIVTGDGIFFGDEAFELNEASLIGPRLDWEHDGASLADINGDGHIDLLMRDVDRDSIVGRWGNGQGDFGNVDVVSGPHGTPANSLSSPVLGDFDGDRLIDFAVRNKMTVAFGRCQ